MSFEPVEELCFACERGSRAPVTRLGRLRAVAPTELDCAIQILVQPCTGDHGYLIGSALPLGCHLIGQPSTAWGWACP